MKPSTNNDSDSIIATMKDLGGIGPRLATLCLPYVILAMVVRHKNPEFLRLKFLESPRVRTKAKVLGIFWLGLGLIFWGYSAIYFLKHVGTGKLITKGPFALCRNPIYSAIIVFMIPGLALIDNSGMILSIASVLYVGFKNSIHGESIPLRRTFGDEYEEYESSVNEIFPFPRYLFGGKAPKSE
jgi:protein-S-isoprenylcysteine O-methyltransferase Ste14